MTIGKFTPLETRVLEIRDRGTHIGALGVRLKATGPNQGYEIHYRAGFSRQDSSILLTNLSNFLTQYDAYNWGSNPRTMVVAHQWIEDHFDELSDGDVVDVEFILGETETKKLSENEFGACE